MKKYTNYNHPKSEKIVALLKENAVRRNVGESVSKWDIDEYELHTHPDLQYKLEKIAADFLSECEYALFGYPVLATSDGVIFCIVRGTSTLALRVPGDVEKQVKKFGGMDAPEYGDDWVSISPWSTDERYLKDWCQRAHEYATTVAG